MSSAMTRSPLFSAAIFFGLFFGGGFVGIQLSRTLAPESGLAEFVSFLALPAAFVIGNAFWAGAAIPAAVRRIIRLVRESGRVLPGRVSATEAMIPPGSFAFVPAALLTSTLAGGVVATISRPFGFLGVIFLYTALGLAYGVICWRLARSGYLPFPRE
ncbi:MAG: hypothetical protein EG822_15470 [Deltaproteobacteria bacterium]|nr:hypothetical protein [Deltaproteobacteria bacterium]TLN02586.1 MAG: hypothetical protein FDZ73_11145 [bacterium]